MCVCVCVCVCVYVCVCVCVCEFRRAPQELCLFVAFLCIFAMKVMGVAFGSESVSFSTYCSGHLRLRGSKGNVKYVTNAHRKSP